MTFFSEQELHQIGFNSFGENVFVSRLASIHNASNIDIGSNVRIDDFCVLSAGDEGILIGNYVHLAVFSSIMGSEKVILDDFSCLSSRVALYSSNDDYSGLSLTNPMVPEKYRGVTSGTVYIGRHVVVGAGCVILPAVRLEQGVAVGALSLVSKNCAEFSLYAGRPAKKIKDRKRDLLKKEEQFMATLNLSSYLTK